MRERKDDKIDGDSIARIYTKDCKSDYRGTKLEPSGEVVMQ